MIHIIQYLKYIKEMKEQEKEEEDEKTEDSTIDESINKILRLKTLLKIKILSISLNLN